MMDILFQIGVSNFCISFALALGAWALQRTGKHPRVAHLLWLVVLVKLLTPSGLTLPVIEFPPRSAGAIADAGTTADFEAIRVVAAEDRAAPGATLSGAFTTASTPVPLGTVLLAIWIAGGVLVLLGSLARIVRFHRLLGQASEVAPAQVQRLAAGIARRLGLRKAPTILTTSARVTPLVWWVGGRVRVVLPAELSRDLDDEPLYWILAHELGHVRRGDHLIRWLEWLACVVCWWNPVAWWARRNLRRNEEICCDALVLSRLKPTPRTYARSLLTVVEYLSAPALRPPAMASGMDGGGSLERRLKMIISANSLSPTPRWLSVVVLLGVLVILPLGIARAGEPNYEAVGARLAKAVHAGELTRAQAEAMMGELARSRFSERMATVDHARADLAATGLKIRAAVREGRLSVEEARAKIAAVRESFEGARRSRDEIRAKLDALSKSLDSVGGAPRGEHATRDQMAEVKKEIWAAVEAGKITEAEAKEKWAGYLEHLERVRGDGMKAKGEMPTREEMGEVKEKIWAAVEAGQITEEQAEERWEHYLNRVRTVQGEEVKPSIGDHFEGLGIERPHVQRIRRHLGEQGLTDEQTEKALGGLLRLVHGVRTQGEGFELDPGMRRFLAEEVGLKGEQIEMLVGVARRIAARLERSERRPPR